MHSVKSDANSDASSKRSGSDHRKNGHLPLGKTQFRRPSGLQELFEELVQVQTKFLKAHERELVDLWLLVGGGSAFEASPTSDELQDCSSPLLCATMDPTVNPEVSGASLPEDKAADDLGEDDSVDCLSGCTVHVDDATDHKGTGEVRPPRMSQCTMKTSWDDDASSNNQRLPCRLSLPTKDAAEEYYHEVERQAYASANKRTRHSCSATSIDEAEPTKRCTVQHVVKHIAFDLFFGTLILLNAIVMAAEIDYNLRNGGEPATEYEMIGKTFTLLFVLELFLRIGASGCRRFFRSLEFWNYFDCFLVTTSLIDIAIAAFVTLSPQSGSFISVRVLRLLRITRAIKVFRAVRIVRFVKALRTLLNSLIGTMKQVVWAFVLMFALCFLFAVMIAQAVSDFRATNFPYFAEGERLPGLLGDYWGSVPRCMYTLFMSLSNGIEWEHVAAALVEVGAQWAILFMIYVALIQYVVLNVVIGVFCESAAEAARQDVDLAVQNHRELKDAYCARIRAIFRSMDSDGSNTITYPEMRDYLEGDHAKAMFSSLDMDIENIWELFRLLDAQENAIIEIDEFVMGCLRLKGNASALDLAKMSYDHKVFRKRMFEFMKTVEATLGPVT
eukprot:TRINITY_DN31521_c0_g3_i6.p1 TRINITY_DN31521_c0_g3~~TRINITY_DN31521_c0_g3_i6.p1  ORF type:complete len:615 (-),score=86.53 TRINITY_DN31521_c0_g3_i6:304-2148(-)